MKRLKISLLSSAIFALVTLLPLTTFAAEISNTSISSDLSEKDLVKQLLFKRPNISPPTGKSNLGKILKWKRVYSERDLDYDKCLIRYKHSKGIEIKTSYQKLIEGWNRLINDGHLIMIYKKCKEKNAPFDIVFLAMAESYWNQKAYSVCGAKGYWQFIRDTAIRYGLIHANKDNRTDPVKSTEAAIRLLKDNYSLTFFWDNRFGIKSSKVKRSDRWLWAFWAYNRSPAVVSKYYKKLRGNPSGFAARVDNDESANYVNKIFGIREVLKEYMIEKEKEMTLSKSNPLDKLLIDYKNRWYLLPLSERLKMLEEIKNQYGNLKKVDSKYPTMNSISNKIWYIKQILLPVSS